jgi:hypothetical protein
MTFTWLIGVMCHQSGNDTCQVGFNCMKVNLLMCAAWCDATCTAMWQDCWDGLITNCHVAYWWGPLLGRLHWCWAHICWGGPIDVCHVAHACWLGLFWCRHVAHPLSSIILYILCFLVPSLHPKRPMSPSCIQSYLDQISALDQFI